MKYKVNVNDSLAHQVELTSEGFTINGEPVSYTHLTLPTKA
jgi:hypothetical protein